MHEQSRFLTAPVLSAAALVLAGTAIVAEMVVRSDDQTGIVRTISSDDQQEIDRADSSELAEDFQADLLAIVQDGSLAPLTSDKLRSTAFFRTIDPSRRANFEAFVGKTLARRKRYEEALDVLSALSPEQRIEHGVSFSYAQSFRGAGKIETAIAAYAVHVAANPNHNPGYVNYGILLAETGRHDEAIRVFEHSVDITSSSRKGKSLSLLGQSQVALGEYEAAIDSFDRSIQYRPDNGPTWRRFASTKARSGNYPGEEIEADYQRALALEPDDAETMKEWAEYNFSFGRFETAMPMFRAASAEAANDFDTLFSRAVNLLASERPRAARQVINTMANIEMSSEQALLHQAMQETSGIIRPATAETRDAVCADAAVSERLAYACLLLQLELDEKDRAVSAAELLAKTSIYTQPAAFALARYEYRNAAPEAASQRLDQLLETNPNSPLFWLYKARTAALLDASEAESSDEEAHIGAQFAFERALELNPESRKTTLEFSTYLAQQELFSEAENLLVAYLDQKPTDGSVLTALANVYASAGDLEEAETTLLRLMDLSEDADAETTEQLVSVQVSLEKYADALSNADNLLDQDPANISVRYLRVEALTALNREEEADAERDRIQRLMPESETDESASAEFAAAAP